MGPLYLDTSKVMPQTRSEWSHDTRRSGDLEFVRESHGIVLTGSKVWDPNFGMVFQPQFQGKFWRVHSPRGWRTVVNATGTYYINPFTKECLIDEKPKMETSVNTHDAPPKKISP